MTIDRGATTLDHPEITISKRPADSSGKVDVVNQNLANFNATSTTKFEDGNFRNGKYNARNEEKRANSISHDDSDVTAYYRRYTSPRHCYRLPPRTKQPQLLETCALNRNIGVSSIRAIADFAPRNSKPPVREPNVPEKREKKDERRDKKERKKPVIRTDGESADSSENRAEMVADDNPKGDLDTAFRYEWGVKLAEEESAAEVSDNDNLAEKSRRYVTKRFWGVNLKQPRSDVGDASSPTSKGPERNSEEHRNASPIAQHGDTIADETRSSNVSSTLNLSAKEPDEASNLKGTTAEYLSTPSYRANLVSPSGDSITARQEKTDSFLSSEALRRIMKTSSDVLEETIAIDNEYNVPEGATLDTEITAWKNLAMRSRAVPRKEDCMSPDNVENMEMVSIRPEAPQPKLDVRVVKSTEDTLEEFGQSNAGYKDVKSMEIKHFGSPQKPDGYVSSKRLHTACMQIRYPHRHISSIATLSINSVPVDKTTRMKCSRLTSAFSTDPESSKEVIIKTLNQQSKEGIESKSWNKEGKSNDSNANNLLSIKRPLSPSLESRTFSSSNQKPLDTDKNVIANKEMEISLNPPQTAGHCKKIVRLPVSSESARKDESHFKNEDELERYENSNASYMDKDLRNKDSSYIDFDTPSADSGPVKSSNAKLGEEDSKSNAEGDKNATLENAEDEYIVDGDYVRLPGDPYPYSRENLDKWRASRFRDLVHRPIKVTKFDSVSVSRRPSPRNANDDAYANNDVARDSHAGAVMKTSGSGDGAAAKNAERGSASGFHVSPRSQRVASDCLRGDAADALGLRRWTEAFSRLDVAVDGEMAEGGDDDDDASSRAYHQ